MGAVRVGVTGHRRLQEIDRLTAAVDETLDELDSHGTTGGVVVSSLAEGADRLVATRALVRPGWRLEAILPLAADDFADDFATAASLAEFRGLLDRADLVTVVDAQPDRDLAYRAAGFEVVASVDALIAIWDGAPARGTGGTAEIVAHAAELGTRVLWIAA